ncbi:MAG: hypothetical protein QNK05_08910 [Myxococcota bacterium]|nr:hypothetical protein [Myxococcota bacterium]
MTDWTKGERGTLLAMRLGGRVLRLIGRRAYSVLVIAPIVVYFVLLDRTARRGSAAYLRVLAAHPEGASQLGPRPGLRHVLRHFYEFALQLVDRALLWSGNSDVTLEYEGDEHLRRLRDEGRGGILLGAHQGSFDMMRVLAARYDVPVNVLMFTDKAERLGAYFRELSPESAIRVLAIDPTSVRTAFEIRACIERGEFVGILGDRRGLLRNAALHETELLGRRIAIPLQPFSLAAVLGCPILRATCLRREGATYHVEVKPLRPLDPPVPGDRPGRREQHKIAGELAESFVAHLERTCLQAPYQWFNFFDFFDDEPEGAAQP